MVPFYSFELVFGKKSNKKTRYYFSPVPLIADEIFFIIIFEGWGGDGGGAGDR